MGFFGLFNRKPQIVLAQIPSIVEQMDRRLKVTREQFVFGVISGLDGEGLAVPRASKLLETGTSIDSALRGFQLTNVVGFSSSYMDQSICEQFDAELTERLEVGQSQAVSEFRERYLDCSGDIDCLAQRLAADIHHIWDSPEPSHRVVKSLAVAARLLGALSQAGAAAALGDTATESKLRRLGG